MSDRYLRSAVSPIDVAHERPEPLGVRLARTE